MNFAISSDVNGTSEYYAKQNKLEKDKCHDFTHMWNLTNKTNEHKGKRKEENQETDSQL